MAAPVRKLADPDITPRTIGHRELATGYSPDPMVPTERPRRSGGTALTTGSRSTQKSPPWAGASARSETTIARSQVQSERSPPPLTSIRRQYREDGRGEPDIELPPLPNRRRRETRTRVGPAGYQPATSNQPPLPERPAVRNAQLKVEILSHFDILPSDGDGKRKSIARPKQN